MSSTARRPLSCGPWLFGARVDLALFAGSAVLALALVALGHATGISDAPFPEWGWIAFILAVDVAHVHATWFRTYFDGDELRRHPLRYALIPLAAWAAGVTLYGFGPMLFWRVLAYLALFHFVRQQVGWVAVYRARAGQRNVVDRLIDDACIYAATGYPVLVWHARLDETRFAWFVRGDFVDISAIAARALPFARAAWLFALVLFAARQLQLFRRERVVMAGKLCVVVATAAAWYVGIVATNSDFDFTVTNVIVHGVPYFGLLWAYGLERKREQPRAFGARVVAGGVGAFVVVAFGLALAEEFLWDRLVWQERAWLFGEGSALPASVLAFVVPLLAVPQATHYVLDGLLWRRRATRERPAQRRALGFGSGGEMLAAKSA
jgi:hypothetical protein